MRYYVYLLLDDTEKGCYDNEFCSIEFKPFYVGKGDFLSKNKIERHLIHYHEVKRNIKKIVNPHKFNKIKKLQENGFEPNFVIVYKDDDEKKVLEIEKKLINFYGKSIDGGILTNIADGGVGGDLFKVVHGLREKIDKIASKRWSGKNNPNYNKPKEETFSYKFKKEKGFHWNDGRKISEKHKEKLNILRYERLPLIDVVCPETLNIIDTLKTVDAIKKYDLNPVCLYRSLNDGGKHKGYYWKYQNKELILSKSKRLDYVKPKRIYKQRKIHYKKDINQKEEIIFNDIYEASKETGFCVEVIRRKCKNNNDTKSIFKYENTDFTFDIKKGKKLKIMSIDDEGNKKIYESITEAAKGINGNPSMIVQVCKGKRKKHRNLKFKYI
jgi:hypothetical protein